MKPSHRRKTVVRMLIAACIVALLYTPVRVFILIQNGRKIAEVSQKFRKDYFVGDATAQPYTYVVMGDSTAAGWGAATLEGSYPYKIAENIAGRGYYVHVINHAVGGAKLNDVCRKQIPQLGNLIPDLITVTIGANDATNSTPLREYERDLKTLFTALQKSDAKQILVADVPNMYEIPALPQALATTTDQRAQQLNKLFEVELRTANEREPRIIKVDLYHEGKLIFSQDKSLYASDRFHPSANGYALWAKLFIQKIREF